MISILLLFVLSLFNELVIWSSDRFNFVNKLKKMKIEYSNIQFDQEGLKVWEADL